MRKVKIYFGDLVHTWEKTSIWTMPLNIGFIAEYAKKHIENELEIRLFKCPTKMIDAIKGDAPDVVALSHYVWNTSLNKLVFQIAKQQNQNTLTVGGGPSFTNLNAIPEVAAPFFKHHKYCDAWVLNQGELGFVGLMKSFINSGLNTPKIKSNPIDGCFTVDGKDSSETTIGKVLNSILNLDEIPSPYLSGLFDEFFDGSITPILESNRSCPYRCTFCAFGIGTQKLARFSEERIYAEIDYITDRCAKGATIIFSDANFSILERDVQIARYLYQSHVKKGTPGHVFVYWNKSNPERVLRTAKEFQGISQVGASMQTFHPDTLTAIKRRNLPIDSVVRMAEELLNFKKDIHLYSDLIVGLPMETWESHLEANKKLMDLGFEVLNFNLHLIPGTEMESKSHRQQYIRKTGWRLHDNAFGIYDDQKVFECQEVVLETTTMTRTELHSFRFLHYLFQFMWGRRWYYDYLMYVKSLGIHPADMMVKMAKEAQYQSGPVGKLYANFNRDHSYEQFDTSEELIEFWSQPENFLRLKTSDYGKLNYHYSYVAILECPEEFTNFILAVTQSVLEKKKDGHFETKLNQCREVLQFCLDKRVKFTRQLEPLRMQTINYANNWVDWKNAKCLGEVKREGTQVEFYLPEKQERLLKYQLNQYKSNNKYLTLRKMSEYTSPEQFFYKARIFSSAKSTQMEAA
ncbi:MAG: radical SAM protein [Deltaproteobacteria bacterium]|nr:radical SAM protein [Deltaproteobacteria bacterium]